MPFFAWTNVAFTWSSENRAQLYTSGYLQNSAGEASTLNNVHGGNNSLRMTVTLGHYDDGANCQGIEGIDSSQKFIGSLDEVCVFTRELSRNEIIKIRTLTFILCH
jgi:hypothetical protein